MKQILTLVFTLVLCSSLIGQTFIKGKVLDDGLDEVLIGVNITFYKNDVFQAGTVSDIDGNYSISLDPGTYDISFSYMGYETESVRHVLIPAGETRIVNMQLECGINLDEIVVVDYKLPNISHCNTTICGGCSYRSKEKPKEAETVIEDSFYSSLTLFPNPVASNLNIRLNQDVDFLILRDMTGRAIRKYNNVSTGTINIDVSDFPAGTYVVQIIKGNSMASEKIIVVRD